MIRAKGTPEEKASFPKPLFLYRFVRAWNAHHTNPNFVEDQLQELEQFDRADPLPLPLPIPVPPTTNPVPPPPPRPRIPSAPTETIVNRPKPSTPPRRSQPAARLVQAPAVASSSRPTHRKVEVHIPPRASDRKFQEIDDEEYSPSPPPPTPHKRKVAESKTESTPESQPDDCLVNLVVFMKACVRCQKAKRDCEVDEVGAACVGCKTHKYGCTHTGNADLKTMVVRRPAATPESGDEIEFVEDKKGKKRKAESPTPVTRRKVTVKSERTKKGKEKVERPRVKVERPKASASKPAGRRRALKSSAIVVDISDDNGDEAMEVDEESEEEAPKPKPRQKRARVIRGKFTSYIFYIRGILIYFQMLQRSTACDLLCLNRPWTR